MTLVSRPPPPGIATPVLTLRDVRFAWPHAASDCLGIEALDLDAGETMFLHGPSGCGKSTLLSLMAGVLRPRQGRIVLMGRDWSRAGAASRDRHRAAHVGYVFQQFNLLPYLGVLDNVLLSCRFSPARRAAAAARSGSPRADAGSWLAAMELEPALWRRRADTLSVGQQQRVAAARALIGAPALVVADEPTSALDEDRRERFLELLLGACASAGGALVFASHDRRLAGRFTRQLSLPAINRAAAQRAAS